MKIGQLNKVNVPEGTHEFFASYYWSDTKQQKQGFGNIVLAFNVEMYRNQMAKLIFDLQKQVKLIIDEQMGVDSSPQILFFR